jgi:glycerol-3-phosphate dehydrogenase
MRAEGRVSEEAFLLTAPQDGRVFFVIPWYGRTLIGTTESSVSDPAEARVNEDETRYLLEAVRALMPGLNFGPADVIASFAGVRCLQAAEAESLSAVTREFVVLEPKTGVLMPLGGKFTTARCDAIEVVDRVFERLQREPRESGTQRRALPGAPVSDPKLGDFTGWQAEALDALSRRGIDAEAARWLTLRHGTRVAQVHALLEENPQWQQRLHPQAPFLMAEAVLAQREEMARDVEDVLRRRMPLSLLVSGADAAGRAAERAVEALFSRP